MTTLPKREDIEKDISLELRGAYLSHPSTRIMKKFLEYVENKSKENSYWKQVNSILVTYVENTEKVLEATADAVSQGSMRETGLRAILDHLKELAKL